jgi:DhnA family fructose-bisphosphate aldolase class Ia
MTDPSPLPTTTLILAADHRAFTPGQERQRAVARVVASVSVPVLFLGGPLSHAGRASVLDEVRDVMEGGGSGMAMGRTLYQDPDPAEVAGLVAALVHQ